MKDNSMTYWIIIGLLVLALILFAPWSMMGGNWGLCGMMGNWNYGSGGYGMGMLISWFTNIAALALIILGIIWVVRKIRRDD